MVDLIGLIIAHPIWFHAIVVVLALALLAKSSSLMITGISSYAKKLGLSDYLVGLFVVALTASIPEFLASVSAIAFASSDIVFGTIFGSNIMGVTLVIGLLALVAGRLPIKEQVFEKSKWDVLLLTALPFLLLFDGRLGKIDGAIMIVSFFFYLFMLWKREGQTGMIKEKVKIKFIYKDSLVFLLSFVALTIASLLLVNSSLHLATLLNIPELLVALLLIGIGAQIPDLFLGINAIVGGHDAVAVGDLIGSMITKSLLFLGIFAFFSNLTFHVPNMIFTGTLTLISCIALFYFIKNESLTRKEGVLLLAIFSIFMLGQIFLF